MNKIMNYFTVSAVALSAAALMQSCSLDEPFGAGDEGSLTITTEIKGDLKVQTRAMSAERLDSLRKNCVIYIENSKGVLRKYKGVDNIPESIKLRTGDYLAEAWSGDSVSASFTKKFYRGKQEFTMQEGNNALTLHCNIANVVTSVDPASLDCGLQDMKVSFSHSRGSLEFTSDLVPFAKGYFMMPNADKDLTYKITGTMLDGTAFEKTGTIPGVQRAHEYRMLVSTTPSEIHEGGALIKITIADIPLIEEDVEIFTAPAIRGVEYDIEKQVVHNNGTFKDTRVYLRGYFGMSSIQMDFSDNFTGMTSGLNVLRDENVAELNKKGILVEVKHAVDAAPTLDAGEVDVDEVYITFSKAFLEGLAPSDKEYVVTFHAVDGRHMENSGTLRIANTDAAIENPAPVATIAAPDPVSEPTAILATSATLKARLVLDDATNYGIEYRAVGTDTWNKAYPATASPVRRRVATRAGQDYTVTITGLTPGTTYEYRAFADGCDDAEVMTFTTEGKFQIPNASFEDWSTYSNDGKDIIFAGTGNSRTFWDSGNQGSATAGKVICNSTTDMVHSGSKAAKLTSLNAMLGVLAAGNIFVGEYVKTDVTNGVLSLGRQYNGSHPTKLAVWANYRPGKVDKVNSGCPSELVKGENDFGQIYVALTDEPIEIRTKSSNQKLFSVDDPHVLAYGQVTWKENFGPDGQLQKIEIPLEYKEAAKSKRATHLVITCCASKFGDFFSGSYSSVLVLDDFELLYDGSLTFK